MKTTFNNAMTAHVWASQSQLHGRSSNGNLYFSGKTLFSYGDHYPLATISGSVVYYNADETSVTTEGKHKPAMHAATRHMESYGVPALDEVYIAIERVASTPDSPFRADILLHAEKYIGAMSESSCMSLLQLAGLSESRARKKTKVWNRAEKKRKDSIKAKREKDKLEQGLRIAKRYLSFDRVKNCDLSSIRGNHYQLEKERKKIYRAILAIRKKPNRLGKNQVKTIKRYYSALLAAKRDAIARSSMYAIHANCRTTIRNIREYLNSENDPETLNLYELERFADRVYGLSLSRYVGSSLSAKLSVISDHAKAIAQNVRKKDAAKKYAEQQEKRQKWLNGESVPYWRGVCESGGALLRVMGDTLETSQGASVPVDHAIKVFRVVKACKDSGKKWTRNGETIRVGHFHVDEIYPDGSFKAGCHNIYWSEVERIAMQLNLIEESVA